MVWKSLFVIASHNCGEANQLLIHDSVDDERVCSFDPENGRCAGQNAATKKQYKECAVWFQAVKHEGMGRDTAHLKNIIDSMSIARDVSPGLQFLFFYTRLYGTVLSMTTLRRLRESLAPLDVFLIGSVAAWARELSKRVDSSSERALKDVLSFYPYPLKSVALHQAAKTCEMVAYFDADVLLFRDARELFRILHQSPVASMLAPPEVNTAFYCKQYFSEHLRRNCEAHGVVSDVAMSKLIASHCPKADVHTTSTAVKIFQSSIMVMSREVLELWADRNFVLDYLELVLRVLDGCRHRDVTISAFWQSLPATNAPIMFPSPPEKKPHWFIAEQIAYYLKLTCSGISTRLLDRKVVLTGIFMNSEHFSDLKNCSLSVVAWHTQENGYVEALQWFANRRQRCSSVEELVR